MARILVVDDETRIVSFVSRALTSAGFRVDTAADGEQALELARSSTYDLVVLDLLLPGLDGVAVLREIMAAPAPPPVLVLSALSDVKTKVDCLRSGAADYLAKPFALSELLARIGARLRDQGVRVPETIGNVRLDVHRRVVHAGKGPVSLSQKEFLVLQHLMHKPGAICTRQQMLADVWGYSFDPGTNVIDVYVRRLRAKLGAEYIETIRNVGYRFCPA